MRHAAGEVADGIELLRLPKRLLGQRSSVDLSIKTLSSPQHGEKVRKRKSVAGMPNIRCAAIAAIHSLRMAELVIPALRYRGVCSKRRTPKRRSTSSTGEVVM